MVTSDNGGVNTRGAKTTAGANQKWLQPRVVSACAGFLHILSGRLDRDTQKIKHTISKRTLS